jgi:hypothetical protein
MPVGIALPVKGKPSFSASFVSCVHSSQRSSSSSGNMRISMCVYDVCTSVATIFAKYASVYTLSAL